MDLIGKEKKGGKLFKSSFSLFNVKHIYIINKVIMLSPLQQLQQQQQQQQQIVKSLINK